MWKINASLSIMRLAPKPGRIAGGHIIFEGEEAEVLREHHGMSSKDSMLQAIELMKTVGILTLIMGI